MSFILDALRKSEHERERKTLPGLAEAPIVRHERAKVPVAMIALGVLLAINLLVLLFVLLRDGAPDAATATAPAHTPTPAPTPAPAHTPAPATAPAPAPTSAGVPLTTAPLPASPEVRPLQAEAGVVDEDAPPYVDTPPVPRDPTLDGEVRVQRAPVATDGSAVTTTVPPEVLRAAQDSARRGAPPTTPTMPGAPARDAGGAAGVPSINDLAPQATAGLPALAINLHVYAGDPRQDFVVLNGRRYQQGAQLQEGPTLERITSDGVVLNHRGLRFLLPRQ
jgi:general secretion pathway protein B